MRIPISATVLVLAALAGFGGHNHRQLAALKATRDQLVARAAARGLPFDPAHPEAPGLPTKLPRPDREAEVKRIAAGLITHATEIDGLRTSAGTSDAAIRQRMMEQSEQLLSLDRHQLKILISELAATGNLDGSKRTGFIVFAVEQLARNHPIDALKLLADSPEVLAHVEKTASSLRNIFFTASYDWARADLSGALAWFRKFRGDPSNVGLDFSAMIGLVLSAAERDPALASSLIGEFGVSLNRLTQIVGMADTPGKRVAMMGALRQWQATLADPPPEAQGAFDTGIRELAFGDSFQRKGFDFAIPFIEGANLTPREFELVMGGLPQSLKPAETGRWVEWLEETLPPEAAQDHIREIFTRWSGSDPGAAEKWLSSATESAARHSAALAHAERVFSDDREAALGWALSVPESDERDLTLKTLYEKWPKEAPADEQAAEAFAKEHGLR